MQRYVVTAIPRGGDEPEPVHPGVLDRANAEYIYYVLAATNGTSVCMWESSDWEDYVWERDKELFCDTCGNFIEDCDCEVQ